MKHQKYAEVLVYYLRIENKELAKLLEDRPSDGALGEIHDLKKEIEKMKKEKITLEKRLNVSSQRVTHLQELNSRYMESKSELNDDLVKSRTFI